MFYLKTRVNTQGIFVPLMGIFLMITLSLIQQKEGTAAGIKTLKPIAKVTNERDSDLDSLQDLEKAMVVEKNSTGEENKKTPKFSPKSPIKRTVQSETIDSKDEIPVDNSNATPSKAEGALGETDFPEIDNDFNVTDKKARRITVEDPELKIPNNEDRQETVTTKPIVTVPQIKEAQITVAPIVEQKSELKAEITNLEFKMEGDISRVSVTSKSKLRYREIKNIPMKQLVYLFENVFVPERLERAYDTSEFVSPVALFTLLQVPKSRVPMAKLIIQLREDKVPVITNTERGMFIDFPAPDDSGESRAALGDENKEVLALESDYSVNQSFSGKPIERLEIKNTDIQDVIRLIGRSSGYNIVIGEDVTGKIGSVSLENIPWDQAFALVLQSKKLGYIRQGNVLRVGTLASLKSEKDEIAAVEISKIKAEPIRTVLIPISYAKASDLAPKGKALMTERGTIEVDDRSNSVIVRDVDRVIGKLQKLFAMLDTQPPIVAVSAKIVEMKTSLSRSIGINALNLGNLSGVDGVSAQFIPGTVGTSFINIKANDFLKLDAIIGLSELDGEVKVLANPSVSVSQNQKAEMKQTLSTTIVAAGGGIGAAASFLTIDANLSLEVTPIVSGDGSISMTVNVKNDVVQPTGGANFSVDKRSVQTQVLLENGDTAVIGGAFQSTVNRNHDGIPGLMRLPLIGMLFSSRGMQEVKNEILIFLTAKILNTEESFKRTF